MRSLPRLLVLWVPDWPVLAHARVERIASAAAIALVEKNEVVACSARAREEGVRRGMRRREAQARSPQLHMLRYDAALDARAFEPLLVALEQSLPGLHPLRPGTVAVRARGPARYYGGERAAGMHVLGIAHDLGADGARVGVADGLFAAERAAKDRENPSVLLVEPGSSPLYLAPLPVTLLDDQELLSLLPRLGIRTLGEFAALGADDVLARFGSAGARLHALAGGRDARSATPRIPPKDVDAVVDFEPSLDRVDQIAFGVRQAADEFVGSLLAQKLVCTALRVELVGDQSEASERVWLHPRSFSPAEIVDRVRWQVGGALDPRRAARPTEGELRSAVTRVRLTPEAVDPAGAHERGLWGTGPDEGVHSALSRVQGMVGHEGVLTAAPSGGRGPAERQTLVPWGDRPLVARDPEKPWPGALPAPAPATVYELPRGIAVEDPGGAPVTVDARGRLSGPPAVMVSSTGARRDLTAWAGPWPLGERWWDPEAARRSDRFQAVDTEGVAWLLVLDEGGWWAEGRYD